MAKTKYGLIFWPFPLYFNHIFVWKWPLQRKHFPMVLRAHLYIFGISGSRRTGITCKLIQNPTFFIFWPPLICIPLSFFGYLIIQSSVRSEISRSKKSLKPSFIVLIFFQRISHFGKINFLSISKLQYSKMFLFILLMLQKNKTS